MGKEPEVISGSYELSKASKSKRLVAYLLRYKSIYVAALLCMVVYGATDGGVPFLVKNILDGVFAKQDKSMLYIIPPLLIAFALIRALTDFGQQFLTAKVGHYIVRDIRNDLNAHLLKLSPDYFVEHSSADILSRITSDVVLVRAVLTESLGSILRDSVRVVALLCAAVYLDPYLAMIAFVVFPLGIYPVYRFGRKLRKLSKRGQDAIGSISSMLQESILGSRVVRIFGREQFERERFESKNRDLTDTFVKSERVRAFTGPVNEVLASCAIAGIILYGGYSVIGGIRSQGEFIAFLLSVFLLYDPFKKLSRIHGSVQQGMAGAERLFEILDSIPKIRDAKDTLLLGASNEIEFDGVSFKYASAESEALSDINLRIPEKTRVALVGFSGAGKSTLVDLVPRFIDPTQGRVLLGGVDVSRVKLADLRARISLVGQHTFLFNDTVFNNIAYGRAGATKDEVIAAAKAAYAFDFVTAMPNGFETLVGEGGFSLSGGERQRIAIARAILKNSPILILDEATASLDNRSEREVQSALEALEKDRTTLIIAHRLSTVRHADLIVVLKDGRIVEQGTHDELLKLGGEFARLHSIQFSEASEKELPDFAIN